MEFAIHLWNNVNQYLFNFIDSVILINVLYFFFSGVFQSEKPSISAVAQYIKSVGQIAEVSQSEQEENKRRNSHLVVDQLYSVEDLYRIFSARVSRECRLEARPKGPLGQKRELETVTEHFKDLTFKPKILKKSKMMEHRRI